MSHEVKYFDTPGALYAHLRSLGYERGSNSYPWEWQTGDGLCDGRVDYKPGAGYYFVERA